jgi:RNA polymerase sigma-70 factor (ECF subfamily)
MHTTPISLLVRLRQPEAAEAWDRFAQLYAPLIYYWGRRKGLQPSDAQDLVQEVFATLVQKLPQFEHDGQRSFRGWLRTITLNKWRDRQRRAAPAALDPADSTLAHLPSAASEEDFEEQEYRRHVLARALRIMQADFAPQTWQACLAAVTTDRPAAEIAAEHGLTVGAVYAARFRVLARLREELAGLMD